MRFPCVAALLLAAILESPVAAQIVGRPDYGPVPQSDFFLGNGRLPGPSIGRELGDIYGRIDDARDSGAISGRQARGFRREARVIGALAELYAHNGLSDAERNELSARALYLREAVGRARHARPAGRGR